MDKELTKLVERLERIFPHVTIHYEGELFNTGSDLDRKSTRLNSSHRV